MPTYQQRLTTNNLKIDEITAMARNLPDEGDTKPYIELEYIQSNGLQYIDTGIKPKSTTFINFMGTFLQKNGVLMGSRVDGDIDKYYVTTYYNDLAFNYDNNSSVSNVTFGSANVYDITSTYWRLDSQVVNNYSINNFPNYSIFLFALNSSGNTTAYATGKIYYFKIYENNVLVRNFIPVRRKRDGEVCLYDLVNNMFFTNQGTSSFVAGPEKVETTTNIFVQTTEPSKKKGIWLQTNKTAEHYVSDDNVFIGGWYTNRNIPYEFYRSNAVVIGNDIYLFGGENSKTTAYKYNILTDTYTQLSNIPYEFYRGSVVAIGTYIYLLGSYSTNSYRYNYRYNTLTDTYTNLTNIPYEFYGGSAVAVGTDIYLLGGDAIKAYRTKAYKYNTLTNTYTQLTNIPYEFYVGSVAVVGTDIYLLGGLSSSSYSVSIENNYKYNTLTDTYTRMTDIPYEFARGSAVVIDNNIYLLGGMDSTVNNYKYNTLTDAYTQLANIPYDFYFGGAVLVGDNIYLLGGSVSKTTNRKYIVTSKTYSTDNTLVIAEGDTYSTELFDTNFETGYKLKNPFSDAFFYTTQDGLITDIPSYYGNGTNWVNFKNPPQVQNNE